MASGPFYNEGPYEGEVTKQSLGVTGEKNTPAFILTCRIVGKIGPDGVSYQVDAEYERTLYLYLTEKTKDFTLEKLKVLGFNKSSLKFLSPDVSGYVNFVGNVVPLYCKHEEYNGKMREKWSISTPREEKPIEPIKSQDLSKLDALFGRGLREIAAQAEPPKKEAVPSGAPASGDDVPF
jgi:hypothetical protein